MDVMTGEDVTKAVGDKQVLSLFDVVAGEDVTKAVGDKQVLFDVVTGEDVTKMITMTQWDRQV